MYLRLANVLRFRIPRCEHGNRQGPRSKLHSESQSYPYVYKALTSRHLDLVFTLVYVCLYHILYILIVILVGFLVVVLVVTSKYIHSIARFSF